MIFKKFFTLLLMLCSTIAFGSNITTVIVPYPPGASADLAVKHFQQYLQQKKNINIIINYKPGAEGVVGTVEIMKSNPTANILGFSSLSPIAEALSNNSELSVEYITAMHGTAMAVVVNNNIPVTSLRELEKFVKSSKELIVGHGAIAQRKYLEQLIRNIEPTKAPIYVPYKGGAAVINDLIGGHINLAIVPVVAVKTQLDSGRLRLVAADIKINGYAVDLLQNRYKDWKNFSISGLIAPKKTDSTQILYWRKLVSEYLNDEEVKKDLENNYYYRFVPFGEKYFSDSVEEQRP